MILRAHSRLWQSLSLYVAVSAILACRGQEPTTPIVPDPAQLYTALRVNHKAVVLSIHAPYNTVQLQAIPLNLAGDTIETTATAEFFRLNVLDTTVRVDSTTGFVTARAGTAGTRVIAQMTIGDVMRADTVTIMVRTETPARPITRMEFSPPPTDSSWRWANEGTNVNTQNWTRFFDANDSLVPRTQALVHVDANNGAVFRGGRGLEFPSASGLIGETYVSARVYAYGNALADSTLFRRVDPPLRFVVVDRVVPAQGEPTLVFFPSSITAKAGTSIVFMNRFGFSNVHPMDYFDICLGSSCGSRIRQSAEHSGFTWVWVDSIDIEFSDPALAEAGTSYGGNFGFYQSGNGPVVADGGTGNISAFSLVYRFSGTSSFLAETIDLGYRVRKFTVPGTYQFTSTRIPGARGTIIITE